MSSVAVHPASDPAGFRTNIVQDLKRARRDWMARTRGVPRPIPVVVPSPQFGDALQAALAREIGVAMGFAYLRPSELLAHPLGAHASANELAAAQAFWQPAHLRWLLLPEVDEFALHLGRGVTDGPILPRDRLAFAELLAAQLDRYARHRPDWPARWALDLPPPDWPALNQNADAVRDEAWQRRLWRRLRAIAPHAPPHPTTLLSTEPGHAAEGSPLPPIIVVAAEAPDPVLLLALRHLAAREATVSMHVLLPSLGYLGDITRRRELTSRICATPSGEDVPWSAHPLLASLGQQSIGAFLLLEQLTPDYASWPDSDQSPTSTVANRPLLAQLQHDVRAQCSPAGPPAPGQPDLRPTFTLADRSLRVHACHGPRRELEVLRDELLHAFADLPDLRPEDVLIVAPDFDAYAPLAFSILRDGFPRLPLRLTAVPAREANPVAVALLALLRLAGGRHAISDVLDLIGLEAVRAHLDVAEDDETIGHLADHLRASGLTHGLGDLTGRGEAGTWRAALDRLLSGFWFGPEDAAVDAMSAAVHPVAAMLPQAESAQRRLWRWLEHLARMQTEWLQPTPVAAWADRLDRAATELLASAAFDDHLAAARRLPDELRPVLADTPLDAAALADWLEAKLDNATSLRTPAGGEILFGRPEQLRGLPCRVLAVLGLQDGAFPRAARRPAWDLLAHRPERWDADPRRNDRQLFLDLVLAPADRLILSAANRSLRSPHDAPLSACVEDVLRVAALTVQPEPGAAAIEQALLVRHPLQPFAAACFHPHDEAGRSHDVIAAAIAARVLQPDLAAKPFFNPDSPPRHDSAGSTELTLAEIISFWKNPALGALRTLGVEIPDEETDDLALDDAPLVASGLDRHHVEQVALDLRVAGATMTQAITGQRLVADRRLPPGALGSLAWSHHQSRVAPLADHLSPLLDLARPVSLHADVAGVSLRGEARVGPAGAQTQHLWVLAHRVGKWDDPRQRIAVFITVALAAVSHDCPAGAIVLGLDKTGAIARHEPPAITPDYARRILTHVIEGHRSGSVSPLCFAPRAGGAAALRLAAGSSDEDALRAAAEAWNATGRDDQPDGEGLSAAALLAWRDLHPFEPPRDAVWLRWIHTLSVPLHQWWSGSASSS